MNTYPETLRGLINFGLGNESWQSWVDRYKEQYDTLEVDGFELAAPKLTYEWKQIIASTGMTPLPTYVDPESEGYEVALRQLAGLTGNVPTQKQFYRINRTILLEKLQLLEQFGAAFYTPEMQEVFMGLMDESTEGLIQSFSNAMTHQRMQLVSKGKFEINAINNPRGLQDITITFGIPQDHFDVLTGTDRWWTSDEHIPANEGATSDPIEYCKQRVRWIRKVKRYRGSLKMEIAQDLWDDLCTHSKVRDEITRVKHNLSSNEKTLAALARSLNDEEIKEWFAKLIKVDEIVTRDSIATVVKPGKDENGDPDLVEVEIENFCPTNIAFIPTGKIGDIQGVRPLSLGYDPEDVAKFHDGRLLLTTRTVPKTHSIYIDSEFAQLCVPSMPKYMFHSTVTV